MSETHDVRLKRLAMRSMRRGIKEMDLILGGFAPTGLAGLSASDLDLYEILLEENDHDLYAWCSGAAPRPKKYEALIENIMRNSKDL